MVSPPIASLWMLAIFAAGHGDSPRLSIPELPRYPTEGILFRQSATA